MSRLQKYKNQNPFHLGINLFSLLVGALLGVSAILYLKPTDFNAIVSEGEYEGRTPVPVVRVVDGDTVILLIDGKKHRVRLIGVDTPEVVKPNEPPEPYGREASLFLKNLLSGEEVYVVYEKEDKSNKDRFGRDLAYLYRAPDGLFVNQEIVKQGYGRVYRKAKFKYKDEFITLEIKTKNNFLKTGTGRWFNPA